jgi:6-phosphogluconate dehydrogenase
MITAACNARVMSNLPQRHMAETVISGPEHKPVKGEKFIEAVRRSLYTGKSWPTPRDFLFIAARRKRTTGISTTAVSHLFSGPAASFRLNSSIRLPKPMKRIRIWKT